MASNRTFVVGDIHGALKALMQVMNRANVTPDDTLIFLGDYVDGWSQTPELINYLIELKTTHNCVFLRGNHDELFYRWLKYGESNETWLFHGGQTTVNSYAEIPMNIRNMHVYVLENLANYHVYFGDANLVNTEIDRYMKVTKEDIRRVAQKYLTKENRVVLYYLPKAQQAN